MVLFRKVEVIKPSPPGGLSPPPWPRASRMSSVLLRPLILERRTANMSDGRCLRKLAVPLVPAQVARDLVRPLALVQVEVGEVHLHVLAYSAAGCRRPRGPCRQRPFDTFMAALSGGHLACSSARLEIGGLAPPHDGSWSRPS